MEKKTRLEGNRRKIIAWLMLFIIPILAVFAFNLASAGWLLYDDHNDASLNGKWVYGGNLATQENGTNGEYDRIASSGATSGAVNMTVNFSTYFQIRMNLKAFTDDSCNGNDFELRIGNTKVIQLNCFGVGANQVTRTYIINYTGSIASATVYVYENGVLNTTTSGVDLNRPLNYYMNTALIGVSNHYLYVNNTDYRNTTEGTTVLNSPANNAQFISDSITLNASSAGAGLINVTYYIWNSSGLYSQTNLTISGTANNTALTISNLSLGSYTWNAFTCGSDGCNFADSNFTFITGYQLSQVYNSTTVGSSSEPFGLELNLSSGYTYVSAYINYNGTSHLASYTGSGNNYTAIETILVPTVTATINLPFFWNITIANTTGSYSNIVTSIINQSVTPIQNISVTNSTCGAGFSPAFTFDFKTESNLTSINATSVNYIFQYGLGNNTAFLVNGSIGTTQYFNICINSSSSYYVGYGEVDYSVTGYSDRKFYIFNNTRITNNTINTTLYALDTASSTAFQITATSTNVVPYSGYYVGLLRWYPNLNQYNVVEMGKTDENGQTVLNVKTNDVDYRLALYETDGTLVKLLSSIRMVCQTTPCVYSILTSDSVDLTTFLNIQQNLSFNSDTKTFTFTWNDPSQETTAMNLVVYNENGDTSTVVCNNTATGFTGVLVCDVSAYTGVLRAIAYRSASPFRVISQLIEEIRSDLGDLANGGTTGLLIGVLLVISLALIGIASPILVVIFSLIALVPMLILGNITFSIMMILVAIGGVILFFMKRTVT